MILWTVMPMEQVFDSKQNIPDFEEMEYLKIKVIVEKVAPNQYRIVRLITTDPMDYLKPEMQPGSIVNFSPVTKTLSLV